MKNLRSCLALLGVLFALEGTPLEAAYTIKHGKIVNKDYVATLPVQEHYGAAMESLEKKDWNELVRQATIVVKNFPTTPFALEAIYLQGVGYFQLHDYELANKQFSLYLKRQSTPKHFEEAIRYKFAIAEKFKGGAKKHIMGWETMPKWVPAREDAIAIYDEVITALPHHDLGAQALFAKAQLLYREEDHKSSIESFQTLIRRFPKNALAPDSYIGIATVYLSQCKSEYPDPDFLDLAEINLRRFRLDFPNEPKVATAERLLLDMKEVYARSLYETGQFFERTKKPQASAIYYSQLMTKYPDTQFALLAKKRLAALTRASKKGKSVVQQEEAAPAPEQTSSDAEINPPFSQPDEAALTPPEVDQGPSDSEINPPFSQPDEAALTPPSVDGEINPPFSQSDEAMLAAPEFVDEGELTAEGNDPFDKSIPGGPGSASVIDEVSDEVESLQEVLEEFAEEGLPEAH